MQNKLVKDRFIVVKDFYKLGSIVLKYDKTEVIDMVLRKDIPGEINVLIPENPYLKKTITHE